MTALIISALVAIVVCVILCIIFPGAAEDIIDFFGDVLENIFDD